MRSVARLPVRRAFAAKRHRRLGRGMRCPLLGFHRGQPTPDGHESLLAACGFMSAIQFAKYGTKSANECADLIEASWVKWAREHKAQHGEVCIKSRPIGWPMLQGNCAVVPLK